MEEAAFKVRASDPTNHSTRFLSLDTRSSFVYSFPYLLYKKLYPSLPETIPLSPPIGLHGVRGPSRRPPPRPRPPPYPHARRPRPPPLGPRHARSHLGPRRRYSRNRNVDVDPPCRRPRRHSPPLRSLPGPRLSCRAPRPVRHRGPHRPLCPRYRPRSLLGALPRRRRPRC